MSLTITKLTHQASNDFSDSSFLNANISDLITTIIEFETTSLMGCMRYSFNYIENSIDPYQFSFSGFNIDDSLFEFPNGDIQTISGQFPLNTGESLMLEPFGNISWYSGIPIQVDYISNTSGIFKYRITHTYRLKLYIETTELNGFNLSASSDLVGAKSIKYIPKIDLFNNTFASGAPNESTTNLDLESLNFIQDGNVGFMDEKYNQNQPDWTINTNTGLEQLNLNNDVTVTVVINKSNDIDTSDICRVRVMKVLDTGDFDRNTNNIDNVGFEELTINFNGAVSSGTKITNASAVISTTQTAMVQFTIPVGSYIQGDDVVLFLSCIDSSKLRTVDPVANDSVASGGGILQIIPYVNATDGDRTITYNMLSQQDDLTVFIPTALDWETNPLSRTILVQTGFVSGIGSVDFTFVSTDSFNGNFYVQVDGSARGTRWSYSMTSVLGEVGNIGFGEANNLLLKVLPVQLDSVPDITFIPVNVGCSNVVFNTHYQGDNISTEAFGNFLGFPNDYALARLRFQNFNLSTTINSISVVIRNIETNTILVGENQLISSVNNLPVNIERDFQLRPTDEKKFLTISKESDNPEIYSCTYGFRIEDDWTAFDNELVLSVIVSGFTNLADGTIQPFDDVFLDSDRFQIGVRDVSRNPIDEPQILPKSGTPTYYLDDGVTEFMGGIVPTGNTIIEYIFEDNNLNDVGNENLLNGYISVVSNNEKANLHQIHSRYDAPANTPFQGITFPLRAELTKIDTKTVSLRTLVNTERLIQIFGRQNSYCFSARIDIDSAKLPAPKSISFSFRPDGELIRLISEITEPLTGAVVFVFNLSSNNVVYRFGADANLPSSIYPDQESWVQAVANGINGDEIGFDITDLSLIDCSITIVWCSSDSLPNNTFTVNFSDTLISLDEPIPFNEEVQLIGTYPNTWGDVIDSSQTNYTIFRDDLSTISGVNSLNQKIVNSFNADGSFLIHLWTSGHQDKVIELNNPNRQVHVGEDYNNTYRNALLGDSITFDGITTYMEVLNYGTPFTPVDEYTFFMCFKFNSLVDLTQMLFTNEILRPEAEGYNGYQFYLRNSKLATATLLRDFPGQFSRIYFNQHNVSVTENIHVVMIVTRNNSMPLGYSKVYF